MQKMLKIKKLFIDEKIELIDLDKLSFIWIKLLELKKKNEVRKVIIPFMEMQELFIQCLSSYNDF